MVRTIRFRIWWWRVVNQKGSKEIPYTKQLIPQVCQSSMGHFKTNKIGEGSELKFVEYSENKRITLSPDIMEYNEDDYNPKFDLIISTQTMQELGIILNFTTNMIKLVKIKLPMRKIKELQKPNQIYQM